MVFKQILSTLLSFVMALQTVALPSFGSLVAMQPLAALAGGNETLKEEEDPYAIYPVEHRERLKRLSEQMVLVGTMTDQMAGTPHDLMPAVFGPIRSKVIASGTLIEEGIRELTAKAQSVGGLENLSPEDQLALQTYQEAGQFLFQAEGTARGQMLIHGYEVPSTDRERSLRSEYSANENEEACIVPQDDFGAVLNILEVAQSLEQEDQTAVASLIQANVVRLAKRAARGELDEKELNKGIAKLSRLLIEASGQEDVLHAQDQQAKEILVGRANQEAFAMVQAAVTQAGTFASIKSDLINDLFREVGALQLGAPLSDAEYEPLKAQVIARAKTRCYGMAHSFYHARGASQEDLKEKCSKLIADGLAEYSEAFMEAAMSDFNQKMYEYHLKKMFFMGNPEGRKEFDLQTPTQVYELAQLGYLQACERAYRDSGKPLTGSQCVRKFEKNYVKMRDEFWSMQRKLRAADLTPPLYLQDKDGNYVVKRDEKGSPMFRQVLSPEGKLQQVPIYEKDPKKAELIKNLFGKGPRKDGMPQDWYLADIQGALIRDMQLRKVPDVIQAMRDQGKFPGFEGKRIGRITVHPDTQQVDLSAIDVAVLKKAAELNPGIEDILYQTYGVSQVPKRDGDGNLVLDKNGRFVVERTRPGWQSNMVLHNSVKEMGKAIEDMTTALSERSATNSILLAFEKRGVNMRSWETFGKSNYFKNMVKESGVTPAQAKFYGAAQRMVATIQQIEEVEPRFSADLKKEFMGILQAFGEGEQAVVKRIEAFWAGVGTMVATLGIAAVGAAVATATAAGTAAATAAEAGFAATWAARAGGVARAMFMTEKAAEGGAAVFVADGGLALKGAVEFAAISGAIPVGTKLLGRGYARYKGSNEYQSQTTAQLIDEFVIDTTSAVGHGAGMGLLFASGLGAVARMSELGNALRAGKGTLTLVGEGKQAAQMANLYRTLGAEGRVVAQGIAQPVAGLSRIPGLRSLSYGDLASLGTSYYFLGSISGKLPVPLYEGGLRIGYTPGIGESAKRAGDAYVAGRDGEFFSGIGQVAVDSFFLYKTQQGVRQWSRGYRMRNPLAERPIHRQTQMGLSPGTFEVLLKEARVSQAEFDRLHEQTQNWMERNRDAETGELKVGKVKEGVPVFRKLLAKAYKESRSTNPLRRKQGAVRLRALQILQEVAGGRMGVASPYEVGSFAYSPQNMDQVSEEIQKRKDLAKAERDYEAVEAKGRGESSPGLWGKVKGIFYGKSTSSSARERTDVYFKQEGEVPELQQYAMVKSENGLKMVRVVRRETVGGEEVFMAVEVDPYTRATAGRRAFGVKASDFATLAEYDAVMAKALKQADVTQEGDLRFAEIPTDLFVRASPKEITTKVRDAELKSEDMIEGAVNDNYKKVGEANVKTSVKMDPTAEVQVDQGVWIDSNGVPLYGRVKDIQVEQPKGKDGRGVARTMLEVELVDPFGKVLGTKVVESQSVLTSSPARTGLLASYESTGARETATASGGASKVTQVRDLVRSIRSELRSLEGTLVAEAAKEKIDLRLSELDPESRDTALAIAHIKRRGGMEWADIVRELGRILSQCRVAAGIRGSSLDLLPREIRRYAGPKDYTREACRVASS